MKFTKIVDMNADSVGSSVVQSETERDANEMLQYDDMMHDEDEQDNIQYDLEMLLPESREILNEWTCAEIKVDEISSDPSANVERRQDISPTGSTSSIESMDSFYKPEADQSEHEQLLSEQVVRALQRDTKDYTKIAAKVDE